jgi:hypothetical protein
MAWYFVKHGENFTFTLSVLAAWGLGVADCYVDLLSRSSVCVVVLLRHFIITISFHRLIHMNISSS